MSTNNGRNSGKLTNSNSQTKGHDACHKPNRKPSGKINRNEVGTNWNNLATVIPAQKTTSPSKKTGK